MKTRRGNHHKIFRKYRRRDTLIDDKFSRELKAQGEMGRWMRMLYLSNPMVYYTKKVSDEPLPT